MIGLIVTLVIIGVLMWAVETLIPLDPYVRKVIHVVLVLVLVLYILRFVLGLI